MKKRYYRKVNKRKQRRESINQTKNLINNLSPIMIVCFLIFLFLSCITGFSTITIIILAFILALIPNAYSLYKSYKKRQYYLKIDMPEIDNLTGYEFEEFLGEYYKSLGYKVADTPKTNDYGADLILEKEGRRYVLQAKRYKNKVGVSAIQEVVASKAHYNATGAIVATNNYYTQNAWNLAKENHVFLIDRAKLIELIEEVQKLNQKK